MHVHVSPVNIISPARGCKRQEGKECILFSGRFLVKAMKELKEKTLAKVSGSRHSLVSHSQTIFTPPLLSLYFYVDRKESGTTSSYTLFILAIPKFWELLISG